MRISGGVEKGRCGAGIFALQSHTAEKQGVLASSLDKDEGGCIQWLGPHGEPVEPWATCWMELGAGSSIGRLTAWEVLAATDSLGCGPLFLVQNGLGLVGRL